MDRSGPYRCDLCAGWHLPGKAKGFYRKTWPTRAKALAAMRRKRTVAGEKDRKSIGLVA